MDRADSDQEVIQFIEEHLHTVPHLEALLLIWQNSATPWTSDLLAARIYVTPVIGRTILEELRALGVVKSGADSTYHYDPGWDEQRQNFVEQLKVRGVPMLVFVVTEDEGELAPGPMADKPESFRILRPGKVGEELAKL